MTNEVVDLLTKQLNKCLLHVSQKVEQNENGESIGYTIRRNLNEIGESFFSLIGSGILTKYDEVIVRKSFGDCQQLLHEKLIHFGSYWASYQKIVHGEDSEKEDYLRRTNVETATMLLTIRGFELGQVGIGDSTDDYFVTRMLTLLKGLQHVIDKKISELFQPVFFNLLNLSRTIDLFIASGHPKYSDQLQEQQSIVWNLIEKILKEQSMQGIVMQNLSAALFHDYCLKLRGSDTISAQRLTIDHIQQLKPTQQIRVALNLYDIDSVRFYPIVETVLNRVLHQRSITIPDSALAVRLCVAYLKHHGILENDLDIQVKFEDIDAYAILDRHLSNYASIGQVVINEEDMKILYSLNDAELRNRFAACLQGINKNEIETEKKKPHGVSEISDMELSINFSGHRIFWCMPFKSAVEIRGNSVPVNVAYQIFRPFFHLNSCSVLFISAKKCSENLMNEIKRGKDKFNFSIVVLQEQQLARLLKVNNQLQPA